LFHQARASLYAGDLEDAVSRLKALADLAHRTREPAFEIIARVQLARAAAMLGDRLLTKAEASAIAGLIESDPVSPATLHDSGSVALLAGDTNLARRQLARLLALEASNPTSVVTAARLLLQGEIALQERRPADAASLQDKALLLRPWYMYSRARAEAREARGDWSGAADAWKALLQAKGQILQDGFPPDLAIAQARLARAGAQLHPAANRKDD